MTLSTAEEAPPAQRTVVNAALDVTAIQNELAAMRAELAALRQAIADPKGIAAQIAQASADMKAVNERLTELVDLAKKQAHSLKPVITALDPNTLWEYQCVRSRSESVANRLAREGWQLVTAADDWLFFRRHVPAEKKKPEE
jgi:multidrug resistance efflux pump